MVTPLARARSQEERSAATRRRLLEATVSTLCEKGYRGTTTLEVQQRAGVSRGALLHHYGSRAELMVAAIDYVSRERIAAVLLLAQSAPPRHRRVSWAVRELWSTFDGPLFTAAQELWLAARNDPELLATLLPHERIVGSAINGMAAELFGPLSSHAQFGPALELLLDAMRGAASRSVLLTERTRARLLTEWTVYLTRRLE